MFDRLARWLAWRRPNTSDRIASSPIQTPAVPRCESCSQPRTTHITRFRSHALTSEKHLCDACATSYLGATLSYLGATTAASNDCPPRESNREAEIEVDTVIISDVHEEQIVVLREMGGSRTFPIVIGIFEAVAIDRTLRGLTCPRPLTFEAWQSTLEATGTRVRAAVIKDREGSTYFADLRLTGGNGIVAVDMRPSDAVHLAIKARAPILIPEWLLFEVSS